MESTRERKVYIWTGKVRNTQTNYTDLVYELKNQLHCQKRIYLSHNIQNHDGHLMKFFSWSIFLYPPENDACTMWGQYEPLCLAFRSIYSHVKNINVSFYDTTILPWPMHANGYACKGFDKADEEATVVFRRQSYCRVLQRPAKLKCDL